jgi:hypothetical protein
VEDVQIAHVVPAEMLLILADGAEDMDGIKLVADVLSHIKVEN